MNISYIFFHCKSLIALPDITKWNISNNIEAIGMFMGCEGLFSSSSDILKYDNDSIIYKNYKEDKNKNGQKLSEEDAMKIYKVFNEEEEDLLNESSLDEEEIINKIIELNGDFELIKNYIKDFVD